VWSKHFGDAMDQSAGRMAVDANGNVIVVGTSSGNVDFGGGQIVAGIFVAKFSPTGGHQWSKGFGTAFASGVAVDQSGNIFMTGAFGYNINFGGAQLVNVNPDFSAMYLAKFDADGNHLWSQGFGSGDGDQYPSS